MRRSRLVRILQHPSVGHQIDVSLGTTVLPCVSHHFLGSVGRKEQIADTNLPQLFTSASLFAVSFNEKVTRTVRQFSPHLAAKMRPPMSPVLRGRPSSKRAIHICGWPRWVFVMIFSAASCILWFTSCRLLTVLWALAIGLLATLLHASFRMPNLKARLNTFREEFRAVWRNYSEL